MHFELKPGTRIGIVVFLLLLNITRFCAGQALSFNHLTSENGLSNNSVLSIAQDSRGFIWLGTSLGLNRYDGSQIKTYKVEKNGGATVANNIISLYCDSKKTLWVGTGNGLRRYNEEKDDFEKINFPVTGIFAINCIYEDTHHKLWIGTSKGLFTQTDATANRWTWFGTKSGVSYTGDQVKTITEDHNNNIWIGSTTKLNRLWKQHDQYFLESFLHHPDQPNSISGNNITIVHEDSTHQLWVGTQGAGLNLYQPAGKKFIHFYKNNTGNGLIHNNIRTLLAHNKNELWIGTQEGLSVLNTSTGKISSWQNEGNNNKSLSQNSIYSLFRDANGSIWLGTYFGGVNRVDAFSSDFKVIRNDGSHNTLVNNVVSSIVEDPDHSLWIGTEGGGLIHFDRTTGQYIIYKNDISKPSGIASNLVKIVYLDQQGNIWCGTHGGGINVLDKKTGSFKHYLYQEESVESAMLEITSLEEDGKGNLWAATNNGIRLFKKNGTDLSEIPLDGDSKKIKQLGAAKIFKDDSGNIWIGGNSGLYVLQGDILKTLGKDLLANTIFEDRDHNIWVGLRDGSLYFYNNTTQQSAHYKVPAAAKNIVGILQDDQGFLWLSTDDGLLKFDPRQKTVFSYTVADGLAGKEFNYNSYLKDSHGEFYFGGYSGITHFFPDQIAVNHYRAPLVFTNLKLNNTDVQIDAPDGLLKNNINLAHEIIFDHDQNLFTIQFALLNFVKSNKNRYAYQLSGFDHGWKPVRTPSATYTNLPPGNYTFSVKGANNDGIWTDPITLKITVRPPFWRTWWAYLIYALCLAAILFLIARYFFIRALLTKEDELHQLKLNFFTNVSHEIRTHLALIMAPIEKLLDINLDDRFTTQQLLQVRSNSNRLLNLVNELMDFRKAESNHLNLQVKEQDLVAFLQDIYTSFSELSLAKNIQISFTHSIPVLPLYFDEKQLEKVFFNLLANAFKFTPEQGRISVNIVDHTTHAEITVADSGIGIDQQYMDKLFTNYYQVADHGMQNTGYGLGLALSKKITELHHGEIRVESMQQTNTAPGYTHFYVTLLHGLDHFENDLHVTVYQTHHTQPITVPPVPGEVDNAVPPTLNPTTVLIAEDNPELKALLAQHLESSYHIIAVPDGRKALEAAMELIPDIIISDITMPEIDGIALCNTIKTDERTSHIPVILLTAKSTQTDQIKGLEGGADIYITKPFSFKILELHLRNLLDARSKMQQRLTKELAVLTPASNTPEASHTANKVDDEFLAKLIQLVNDHLDDTEFGVDKLSRKMAMSPPILYKKIRALTNMSVNEFIKSLRFKKAAELLLKGDLNVNEVSFAVGYDDRKYFSREFKKHYGVPPSEFNADTASAQVMNNE